MPKMNVRSRGQRKSLKRRVLYVSLPDQADRICSGCETCQLMCSLQHNGAFNPKKSRIKVVPLSVGISIPVTCQQCEDPWCQQACPEKAIISLKRMNLVIVDEKKCTGCMACIGACPYGIMVYDPEKKKALKCDLCGGDPACVQYCPSKVLVLADHQRSAEVRRQRFAAILANEDATVRHNIAGAQQIKTLPSTMTQLSIQASKQLTEGRR
ncbi:MAG: 4Fe-4S dicluster domain-containing protein [Deltaproteobacteria bacterium]|nr:4Fe-4S dicluster domain-containing protein [Deltaproteobacteria bacterium]